MAVESNALDQVPTEELPPSRMRGTESLYGYVVAVELVVVAVLNLTVRTGTGAPAHPQTTLQVIGIAASVALFGLLQVRSRTIVGFGAIVAAFFVTLPKVPNSLSLAHILALAVPLIYGLILTQRQRRATGLARGSRRGGGGSGSGTTENSSRAGGGSGRRGSAAAGGRARNATSGRGRRGKAADPAPTGPRASARYTPPKAKRAPRR
jgi:uncharacterized membrane protein YgcG